LRGIRAKLRYSSEMRLKVGNPVLLAAFALGALGCATQRELIDRSASAGLSPCSFWPPPRSTSLAIAQSAGITQPDGLNGVANRIATQLRSAGYPEPRWYPTGLGYRHGFAATTRLEALNGDGTAKPELERWSSLYPEAANLRWLTLAQTMPLPRAGRYRVFLIAVTDLPIGASSLAPVWNENTVMDGPGVRSAERSAGAIGDLAARAGYRVGVYVYRYERAQNQAQGQSSAGGAQWSATAELRAAHLWRLAESPFSDTQ